MDVFENLNQEQMEAVNSTEGYVRVIAGAGTGKTKTLTCRYINIVKKLGISPNNILSVTFTNKAAAEMKTRIRKVLNNIPTPFIKTFHGTAAYILKEESHSFCWPKSFSIMDTEDQLSLLKECYKDLNISPKILNYKNALKKISIIKNTLRTDYVELLISENNSSLNNYKFDEWEISNNLFKTYIKKQRKNFYFDFDDLILVTIHIFQKFPDILNRWSSQFQYIQVDEYQDISKNESLLVHFLQSKHKNLFVVGDPDQTIYSWRGADISSILTFDSTYQNTKTITLIKNYRSSQEILDVANQLIKHNKNRIEKDLISIRGKNTNVMYVHSKTRNDENEWLSTKLLEEHNKGTKYNDMAIIYRSNRLSKEIEEKLLSKNIPYRVFNGIEFYQRKEIKDSIALLKLLVYGDDLSFQRIINTPARGFGQKKMEYLTKLALKSNLSLYETLKNNLNDMYLNTKPVEKFLLFMEEMKSKLNITQKISDVLNELLEGSGYLEYLKIENDEDRLENINELQVSIKRIDETEETSLDDYLTQITLVSNLDIKDEGDRVNLLTTHNAKGLEFSKVFIICLCESIFPSSKVKDADEMEEERRVAYVSYTRAKENLFLLSNSGYDYNIQDNLTISRFVLESNSSSLNIQGLKQEEFENIISNTKFDSSIASRGYRSNISRFSLWDIVYHNTFGYGGIFKINGNVLEIVFENGQTRNISSDSPAISLSDKKFVICYDGVTKERYIKPLKETEKKYTTKDLKHTTIEPSQHKNTEAISLLNKQLNSLLNEYVNMNGLLHPFKKNQLGKKISLIKEKLNNLQNDK